MIRSWKHKGLKALFEDDDTRGVQAKHAAKLLIILDYLDSATQVQDMGLPGLGLHPLKGGLSGKWAVKVSGNWRLVFGFEDGEALDVDLVDYH